MSVLLFVCGFTLGTISGIALLVVLALAFAKKGEEEK